MATRSLTDVIVVGAGIIGASIAWRLARRFKVILCDAQSVGGEASWAGAGMLVPGSEYSEPCPALTFALHSLSLYPGFVAELEEESGLAIDFSQCGSLELAGSEEELEQLAGRRKAQLLDRREVRERVPGIADAVAGALLDPLEGQVDPRTVVAALAVAGRRRGLEIREQTAITALRWGGGCVVARTAAGGEIVALRAVIAAGAWSSGLDAGVALPRCYPVRGHLLGYRLEPGSLAHVLRFHHTYVVQRLSGYTIAGTSEELVGFDRAIHAGTVAAIAGRAHLLVPGLLPPAAADAWTGFRPGSDSSLPYLGRVEDSPVWLAYGHYRNGILLAPATAERIAAELTSSLEKAQGGPA